ncbi:MAG TPA: hypothetical protein VHJ17_05295 [Thermomonospora sp.]|nr:hypothetical protein [Thermomonospora sp.]
MTVPVRRPHPAVLAAVAAAVLALAGCGGGGGHEGKDAGSTPGGSSGDGGGASAPDGPPAPKGSGAPLPSVQPVQVRPLVGRWVGNGPAKDYFVFRANGTASWMVQGRALWTGQVIPEGKGRYRFSWEGTDPRQASYWGVTLKPGGKSLEFGGNNQTYTKAAR